MMITGVMTATGAGAALGAPRSPSHPAPRPKQVPAVRNVKPVAPRFAEAPADPAAYQPAHRVWPAASSATIALAESGAGARVKAGPAWARAVAPGTGKPYAGPGSVRITVLDHAAATAAGVDGVLTSVSADGSGPVRIGLDYGDFAQAYGGDYGSRLGLVSYPACVLTTPAVAACRKATPLASSNDATAGTVSATVAMTKAAPMVVAATSTAGGSGGTYAATSLKASGTWNGGGNAGDFTYSYPITTPTAASSFTPKLNLSYDSAASDGETAATQAQPSWLGEGWNTQDAYVEQSFQNCSESPEGSAAPTRTFDQCYDGPIYTLSLNGVVTSLVWDAAKKVFRTQDADGSVIQHFCTKTDDATCTSGTGNGSGAYAQDWWRITDRDGTSYSFGMNHLPGWAQGKAATNSVATQPVYSAHSGDPCYDSAGMSSSVCTMAYRWGLDYAADVHGNAMSYYYDQDTNFYGRFNGATNVSYVRDMYLDHIDYGFRDGGAYGTVPDKVVFTTGQRCVSDGCGPLNSSNAAKWPDVPFDLVCASGADCDADALSYFSTVRLTGIQTQQYSATAQKYNTVDSYAFTQTEPAAGDGTAATLWLSQIAHTGSDLTGGGSTSAIALPAVTFTPLQLQNRVDTTHDGLPGFYKYRIGTITTETGSQINVTYELPDRCTAPVKITASANSSSCYPVSWTPTGYTDPITDWFNKWAVEKVVETDPTGGASAQATSYQYEGGAAWHFDDNELVKAKYRTYGQFRGYGDVVTSLGDGVNDRQAKSETTYYRGMGGNVTDSQGGVHEDLDRLAGAVLETSSLLGDDVDHSTITSYWVSGAAASRSRTGLPALTSNWVQPVETYSRQAVTSGSTTTWRYTATDRSYVSDPANAAFGLGTYAYTHTVPVDSAYDSCTGTTYAAANTARNLVGLVAATETDSVACGGYTAGAKPSVPGSVNTLTAPASVSRPARVVSATRNFYDDPTFSTTFPQAGAPATGDVTMVRKAADYTGGGFTWQTLSRSTYDTVGRPSDLYDGNGNDTATTYTVDSAGLVVGKKVTNALGQATSSTLDPARGLMLSTTDPNGTVTTSRYDALGRVSSVWLNGRTTDTPADYDYAYQVSASGPTAVTTRKLNDAAGYQTSTLIYDGLLRPRQTQTVTPQGGRLVTDRFYDSRGWLQSEYDGWWDGASLPNTTLVSAADLHDQVPQQHFYTYNSLGAKVLDVNEKNGVEVSRAYTVDNGDRTTVYPPAGGTVATTVSDPLGRTTELDSYVTVPLLTAPSDLFTGRFKITGGTARAVTYGYDGHGKQNSTVQGAGGPSWTEAFNLLGQVVAKTDPDAGNTTGMTYDGAGNLTQTTDARNKTVSYSYDKLSRRTGQYAAPVSGQLPGPTGNQIAGWVYDNSDGVAGVTQAIGRLTGSATYRGGKAYTTQQLNFDVFGNSLGTSVTVPDSEGALAGTYTVKHKYSGTTGLLLKDVYNLQGGLPSETVNYGYQGVLDLPDRVGGLGGYADSLTYDAFGRLTQEALGAAPDRAYLTDSYDDNSGRLTGQLVTRTAGATQYVDQQAYTYDLAGNLTRQSDTRLGSSGSSETQCFRYDGLIQLLAAWTANDNCAGTPAAGNSSTVADGLGAASAYWTTWTVDALGDRSAQVQHGFAGGPAADTTTTYGYGTNQPHTLTSTSTTGGASTAYGYDATGNMTSRNAGQGNQTLGYDDTGKLTGVTGSTGGDTGYQYDADGNLLLQKGPGRTTLYVGNQQFALNTATGAVTGTRYYRLPDGSQAIRTGTAATAFSFAIGDQHNTPSLYLDPTAATPTWRQYTPYGAPRGTAVAGPDNHGFLNKPMDATTGLTVVGARQYDPGTGRFITDDPVLEKTDPTQLNGYGYAGNDPVVRADPTGLRTDYYDPPSTTWVGIPSAAKQVSHNQGLDHPSSGSRQSASNTTNLGSCTTHVVSLTKHVLIRDDDPAYPVLAQALQSLKSTKIGQGMNEEFTWSVVCRETGACPDAMTDLFDTPDTPMFPSSWHRATGHGMGMMVGSTGAGKGDGFVRRLNDPASMRGATEEEVAELARASGLEAAPMNSTSATGGRGVRYFDPEDKSVQVMFEAGDPAVAEPVHQGPYLKYQVKGGGKAEALRVPLDGNPNPNEGFTGSAPKVIADWGGESLTEVIEDAVEDGAE
jgi:RHS repeat-associated protein